MAPRLQDGGGRSVDPRRRRRDVKGYRACQGHGFDRQAAWRDLSAACVSAPVSPVPGCGWNPCPTREAMRMASEDVLGFEPAKRLAQDRDGVRRRFWSKLKRVAAQLPFVEDLLAAYYCAFDRETPRHVQAALLVATAYFILP